MVKGLKISTVNSQTLKTASQGSDPAAVTGDSTGITSSFISQSTQE